ncbi:hypothetical protein AAE478_005770 [Parahypoxylon ruwenzoriense]
MAFPYEQTHAVRIGIFTSYADVAFAGHPTGYEHRRDRPAIDVGIAATGSAVLALCSFLSPVQNEEEEGPLMQTSVPYHVGSGDGKT